MWKTDLRKFFGIGARNQRDAAVARKRLLECLKNDRREQEMRRHADNIASNRAKERFNSLMEELRARRKPASQRRPSAAQ